MLTGQHAAADASPPTDEEPVATSWQFLDAPRNAVSRRVTQFAIWLDSFFGENRIFQEAPGNYLQLNLVHIMEDHRYPRDEVQLKGKLSLPTTQERLT